uniref:Arginase n=1 Tax=Acrobeloides nanus TaxID=290746 RepID=A0A914CGK4_9BILA
MVGIRSFEPPEQELLEKLGVKIFYDEDVTHYGINDVMSEAIERVTRNTVGYGMSIDIDGFRVEDAPAVGTPEAGGIVAKEFVEFLRNNPQKKLLVTELVEFLPERDINGKSERLIAELIESIYGPLIDSKLLEENQKLDHLVKNLCRSGEKVARA